MGSYQRACPKHRECCCIVLFLCYRHALGREQVNAGLRAFGPPVEEGYTLKRSAGRGKRIPLVILID